MTNYNNMELGLANMDAEQAILGAILLEPNIMDDILVKPEHFYHSHNKNILWAMNRVKSKGQEVDVVSLAHFLGAKIDNVGGLEYLMQLSGSNFTSNVSQHQRIVVELYKRREQLRIAQEMMRQAVEGVPEEVTNKIINDLTDLENNNSLDDEDDGHISRILAEVALDSEVDKGEFNGACVGFRELDKITGGFQPNDLVLIGARPSCGKTALGVNMVQNYALGLNGFNPGPTAVFSIEMPNKGLGKRMLSSDGMIQGDKMRNPKAKFEDKDWGKLYHSIGKISQAPIHMFDKSSIDLSYIRKKSKMIADKYPGEHLLILIDYVQLIKGSGGYNGSKVRDSEEISKGLKDLAKELNATVIGLSQLSRDNEKRNDKRPMMSDLRDGGGWEQAADVIILLHRDDYYDAESDNKGIMDLIVAKHRNGATGTVQLAFKKEINKFLNIG